MKRVVMIALIMAVITSLFAFSVYAAPSPGASFTTNISSDDNNITAYAYAIYEEGVYQLSSQGTEITSPSLLISVRVVNNTGKWVIKDNDQFKLRVNGIYAVSYPFEFVDIENCTITEVATATGRADLTIKGNNSFILAPNETYVMSFRMVVYEGFTTPSIQFFNNQFLNSAYNIDELVSLPADQLAYLALNNELLGNIIDSLHYSGSDPNYNLGSGSSNVVSNTFSEDFSVQIYRFVSNPYLIDSDTELNNGDDNYIQNGTIRYDISIVVTETVLNSSLLLSPTGIISGILPNGYYNSLIIDSIYSDSFYAYNLNSNRLTLHRNNTNIVPYRYIANIGPHIHVIKAHICVPYGTSITFPVLVANNYTSYYQRTDVYAPTSDYSLLRDLYLSIVKDRDDDNTEEAQDMNDEIHDAEQVWYDNNSEALEQVGLSNYRFSSSQSSGITQAVTQFQAVWNALGDWTNVYIFILILSISTYIIRHEPTTRVKQYRSSVQAERAERISYYGHKNAESRASSSGSTLKSVIRRRK